MLVQAAGGWGIDCQVWFPGQEGQMAVDFARRMGMNVDDSVEFIVRKCRGVYRERGWDTEKTEESSSMK